MTSLNFALDSYSPLFTYSSTLEDGLLEPGKNRKGFLCRYCMLAIVVAETSTVTLVRLGTQKPARPRSAWCCFPRGYERSAGFVDTIERVLFFLR